MKTYTVIASQLVFYRKIVQANSEQEAQDLAWEDDSGDDWKDISYGDWDIEDVQEMPQQTETTA